MMHTNSRKTQKEPEINPLKTSSMTVWNTGESSMRSVEQQREAQAATTVNKEYAVKEVIRKYQETLYVNYIQFLGELGTLGFCAMPYEPPSLLEIGRAEYVNDNGKIHANTTYGEYRRRTLGKEPEINESENGNYRKRQRTDDEKSEQSHNYRRKNSPYQKQSSSVNHMSSGWSDEESNTRTNDRFNGNNDHFGGNNDRRGFRRGGRGDRGGRGRGRGGYENRSPKNNFGTNNPPKSGWSDDDENEPTNEMKKEDQKVSSTNDDWDDDASNTSKTIQSRPLTPAFKKEDDEDWD